VTAAEASLTYDPRMISPRAALPVVLATVLLSCASPAPERPAAPPVTVEHALGTTTVTGPPQRVVALGPADADAALALGVTPVGVASTGIGDGIPGWTRAAIDGSAPQVLEVTGDAQQVDLEAVAALQPDLILASGYYDVATVYDRLSAIAPTLAYRTGPATDPWQEVTTQVGRALGRAEQAADVVEAVEARLAAAADAHPDLQGRTFTFGYVTPQGVSTLRDPHDVMTTVPAALGLALSPAVLAIPEGESFAVTVSRENVATLDADVLALHFGGDAAAEADFLADPLVTRLPVVRRGAVVVLDDQQFYALRQPTALSIPYLLDEVAPRLAEAARRR
jgi:iron complex transport system substrate-binding protein